MPSIVFYINLRNGSIFQIKYHIFRLKLSVNQNTCNLCNSDTTSILKLIILSTFWFVE